MTPPKPANWAQFVDLASIDVLQTAPNQSVLVLRGTHSAALISCFRRSRS